MKLKLKEKILLLLRPIDGGEAAETLLVSNSSLQFIVFHRMDELLAVN